MYLPFGLVSKTAKWRSLTPVFLCCPSLLELRMFTMHLPSSAGLVPMPPWGSSSRAVPPTLCQEWHN